MQPVRVAWLVTMVATPPADNIGGLDRCVPDHAPSSQHETDFWAARVVTKTVKRALNMKTEDPLRSATKNRPATPLDARS